MAPWVRGERSGSYNLGIGDVPRRRNGAPPSSVGCPAPQLFVRRDSSFDHAACATRSAYGNGKPAALRVGARRAGVDPTSAPGRHGSPRVRGSDQPGDREAPSCPPGDGGSLAPTLCVEPSRRGFHGRAPVRPLPTPSPAHGPDSRSGETDRAGRGETLDDAGPRASLRRESHDRLSGTADPLPRSVLPAGRSNRPGSHDRRRTDGDGGHLPPPSSAGGRLPGRRTRPGGAGSGLEPASPSRPCWRIEQGARRRTERPLRSVEKVVDVPGPFAPVGRRAARVPSDGRAPGADRRELPGPLRRLLPDRGEAHRALDPCAPPVPADARSLRAELVQDRRALSRRPVFAPSAPSTATGGRSPAY